MSAEELFRDTERRLLDHYDVGVEERRVDLPDLGATVRVLVAGDGPPAVIVPGLSAPAVAWAPLLAELRDRRCHVLELPGHGLAGPYDWQGPPLRTLAVRVLSGALDGLGLDAVPFVANSLGGMFSLWLALDAPERITRCALLGAPAVALAGARGNANMGALVRPVLGRVAQAAMTLPAPLPLLRAVLAGPMGRPAVEAAPDDLLRIHGLAARQAGAAASVRSLLRRILDGRDPRPEHVLTDGELARLSLPVLFVWGDDDVFLRPQGARPSIERMPGGRLVTLPGGHAPWIDDAAACGKLVAELLDAP